MHCGYFDTTLVFWQQQWLVGDAPFCLKFVLKVTHPLRKTPTSADFRLQRLNLRDSENKFNYDQQELNQKLCNEL